MQARKKGGELEQQLQQLEQAVEQQLLREKGLTQANRSSHDAEKRQLYSKVELLYYQFEETEQSNTVDQQHVTRFFSFSMTLLLVHYWPTTKT